MKEYTYVEVELENHKATTSHVTTHRDIINKYANDGFRDVGHIPTKIGPSGKILCGFDLRKR